MASWRRGKVIALLCQGHCRLRYGPKNISQVLRSSIQQVGIQIRKDLNSKVISGWKGYLTAHARARLQFDVAQQPRLLAHLPFSSVDLLQLALESHRYALDIRQDNPDLLLYAQVIPLHAVFILMSL